MKTYEFKVPGTDDTALIEAESFAQALLIFKQMLKNAGVV